MIKPSIESAAYEKGKQVILSNAAKQRLTTSGYFTQHAFLSEFVRQALFESGIRLDGRGVDDYRQLSINLERAESLSTCEIQLGSTLVMTVVTGEIVTPSSDRPVEGILQFTAHVSPHAELAGASQWELTRMLERSLKDSEALDTESLCIVSGERVWQINCSVNVIDGSGGNIIDACLLSVMAALKAFRKADVSVIPTAYDEEPAIFPQPSKGFNLSPTTGSARPNVNILVHHSNSREPLPLSLHHTPITVTLGILKGYAAPPAPASASTAAVPVSESAAAEVRRLHSLHSCACCPLTTAVRCIPASATVDERLCEEWRVFVGT
jgi:exosome complex RNA-binding protein Rrp42 (RNase PH superfamily)